MRSRTETTDKIQKEIGKYQRVDRIFLNADTYIKILEENGGIEKTGDCYQWRRQSPVRYSGDNQWEVKLPCWGDIQVIVDNHAPPWAIIGD